MQHLYNLPRIALISLFLTSLAFAAGNDFVVTGLYEGKTGNLAQDSLNALDGELVKEEGPLVKNLLNDYSGEIDEMTGGDAFEF